MEGKDLRHRGLKSPAKLKMKSVKRGKRRMWDPVVTAAELAWENRKARQGRKDETGRDWMKIIKRVTDMQAKEWRLRTKALREIRFYQKSTVLLIPMKVFCRLAREIGQGVRANNRWHSTAIFAPQNGTENYMV